jgi:MFS family permease
VTKIDRNSLVDSQDKTTVRKYRIAVAALFFLQGLCFASWASRIPDIQTKLGLSEAALGMVLLGLPVGLLISLPFSGWMIFKMGSRTVVAVGLLLYACVLIAIGSAETKWELVAYLFLFGFAGNMSNIAINTQAVSVEGLYKRPIMASFHGLWSLAGFAAAIIGSFMVSNSVLPFLHFIITGIVVVLVFALCYRYTVRNENNKKATSKLLILPEKSLVRLGIIAFCSMICEGAMFDWSGVYFNKVIMAEKAWRSSGYMAFMSTMAAGRFIADSFTHRFGLHRTLQLSGCLICAGLIISITFPVLIAGIIGFLLVGFGVSSVIPLVYSAAGKSKVLEVGIAITAVSTIGFFGFLLGPPLIGFVAGVSSLRVSFFIIALMGFTIFLMAKAIHVPRSE